MGVIIIGNVHEFWETSMRQFWAVSYRWTDTKIQGTRLMLYQRVITRQPQEQPQVVSLLQRPNLNEESTLLARLKTFCNHHRLNNLVCPQLNIAAKRTELWSQHTIINLVLEDHCDRHKILTCRYVKGCGVITDFFLIRSVQLRCCMYFMIHGIDSFWFLEHQCWGAR